MTIVLLIASSANTMNRRF